MKRIEYSTSFKKDLKKYKNNKAKREKILEAISLLANDEPIPSNMRPHRLIGNYQGYMELHIEGDLLLIWREFLDNGDEVIHLARLGSHSELFGK